MYNWSRMCDRCNPSKGLNCFCCGTPETIACFVFELPKSKIKSTFSEYLKWLYNKIHLEIVRIMWWVRSLGKYWFLYFVKHKNDVYATVTSQKL